jgi:AraC family transcriptional regulator
MGNDMLAHHGALPSNAIQTLSGERRSWTCVHVSTRTTRCQGAFRGALTSDLPHLNIILEVVGGRVLVSGEGREGRPSARHRGSHLSMIPAGMRAWQHSACISMFRDLVLEFEPDHILETLEGTLDLAEVFAPRFMFFNPDLLRIAELMASECEPGKPQDVLYGDSLSVALLIGLSRLGRATRPREFRGSLAPWQTKRVLEYLDAHINASVSIKTLADLTQLSQSYFARAFKVSIGVTPYRWLLDARVRRAQQLLVDKGWPLAQIAVESGFADQSHLTRMFRRVTGENPGAWRRRLGPKTRQGSNQRAAVTGMGLRASRIAPNAAATPEPAKTPSLATEAYAPVWNAWSAR